MRVTFLAAAFAFRVMAALVPAAERLRVAAAFLPAARRLRVVAAFWPAARRFRVVAAFLAAVLRFFDVRLDLVAMQPPKLRCSADSFGGGALEDIRPAYLPVCAWFSSPWIPNPSTR